MGVLSRSNVWLFGAAVLTMTTAAAPAPREISIALSSASFATAAARIAGEMGLFERHGLKAKFVVMDTGNAATTALISRSLQVVLSGPGELVAAQARGQKIVIIANTYSGLSSSLVLSKATVDKLGVSPGAPVSEKLKALQGLTIASTSPTSSYTVSFKTAAEALGANIKFTFMAQPAMAAALESGAIQGYIAGAPFWASPITKGSGVLWISGPKAELSADNMPASSVSLQAMRDVAASEPELMKNLVAVMDDLTKEIDEHPDQVKAAVGKLYPTLDAPTLDLLFSTESQAWKDKPLTPKDMAHEITFVKLNGAPLPEIDSVDPASMLFP